MPTSLTQPSNQPTTPQIHPRANLPCPNSSASFWHSEPSAKLLHHRTTPDLPSHATVTIIGSGITGTSVAHYLANDPRLSKLLTAPSSSNHNNKDNEPAILLLEAREICWGATGRNGGHCQPLLFDRTPDIAAFEVKNVSAVRHNIESDNIDCEWRSVTGCRSFWSDELFDAAKRDIETLRGVDPVLAGDVSLIEAGDGEALKRERVSAGARGVTMTRGAGQLWPYKYVCHLVERLVEEDKVNVQTNTPVTGIEVLDNTDSKTEIDTDGGYNILLKTTRGTVHTRHAILATNGYTSALLPSYTDLIVPVRCEMSALHPPRNSTRLPNSYGMVGYANGNPHHDDYLVQRPFYSSVSIDAATGEVGERTSGGHLMFGGGRSHAMYDCIGVSDDDIVDPGEATYLRRTLLGALDMDGEVEGLEELRASHQWTGIKGYSRDNMPWVGKVPVKVDVADDDGTTTTTGTDTKFHKGLWLCGGYTGHGMPNATLCGKAVVEMVLKEMEREQRKGGDETDAMATHRDVCEKLVKAGDLPRSYLITGERLRKANGLPSVMEQEAEGERGEREFALVGGGNRKEDEKAEKKDGMGKCVAM